MFRRCSANARRTFAGVRQCSDDPRRCFCDVRRCSGSPRPCSGEVRRCFDDARPCFGNARRRPRDPRPCSDDAGCLIRRGKMSYGMAKPSKMVVFGPSTVANGQKAGFGQLLPSQAGNASAGRRKCLERAGGHDLSLGQDLPNGRDSTLRTTHGIPHLVIVTMISAMVST